MDEEVVLKDNLHKSDFLKHMTKYGVEIEQLPGSDTTSTTNPSSKESYLLTTNETKPKDTESESLKKVITPFG